MEYTLVDFLVWIATGGGGGVFAYWFWGILERNFSSIDELSKEIKSYLTLLVAVLTSVLGYIGQLAMNYETMPGSATGWIESIFAIIIIALPNIITSRLIHARVQLKGKYRKRTW